MREVAIVSYVQSPQVRDAGGANEVEMLLPVISQVREQVGLTQQDIDFTCSGSCDYLQGAAFAFVSGVDALGVVPPIKESHVEMDAAWALYEAWLKIQMGHADTALIYGFGKSSPGELPTILSLQLDPYYVAPLWPDTISLAALQARSLLDKGVVTEQQMAEVVSNSRANAKNNPNAQLKGDYSVEQLLAEDTYLSPLRKHDCAPITDGASAIIIASMDKAKQLCKRPVAIRGIDHCIESANLGARDLTISESTQIAAERAGVAAANVDIAELHAPFSHQELVLKQALGLDESVQINLSGGALAANTMMAAGLDRIGSAATQIMQGGAGCAVAHATSGACLQQNLVTVLEGV
ncbi:MAG: thiolase domain-containing protein [Pseudomonadales bacterium]